MGHLLSIPTHFKSRMLHVNSPSVYTEYSTKFSRFLVALPTLPSSNARLSGCQNDRLQEPDENTDRRLSPYVFLAFQSYLVSQKAPHKSFDDFLFDPRLLVDTAIIINSEDAISPCTPTYLTHWASRSATRLCPWSLLCSFSSSRHQQVQ